jgi:hypothetical protein
MINRHAIVIRVINDKLLRLMVLVDIEMPPKPLDFKTILIIND